MNHQDTFLKSDYDMVTTNQIINDSSYINYTNYST